MLDPGSENTAAPHRRWFLCPQSVQLSTGNVRSPNYAFTSADATTAYDGNLNGPRPATRDPFVAWPPNGYFPEEELPDNWSFAWWERTFRKLP